MIEANLITQLEAIPEIIITEVQEPPFANFDTKITGKHPNAAWDRENPPYWSHERSEKRAQRRQEHSLRKILHNYQ